MRRALDGGVGRGGEHLNRDATHLLLPHRVLACRLVPRPHHARQPHGALEVWRDPTSARPTSTLMPRAGCGHACGTARATAGVGWGGALVLPTSGTTRTSAGCGGVLAAAPALPASRDNPRSHGWGGVLAASGIVGHGWKSWPTARSARALVEGNGLR